MVSNRAKSTVKKPTIFPINASLLSNHSILSGGWQTRYFMATTKLIKVKDVKWIMM